MTRTAFDALMESASKSTAAAGKRALAGVGFINEDQNNRAPSRAKPEPLVRHDIHPEASGEANNTGRVSVCITSYRKRLTDPDNLVGKYFTDLLRYCGLIRDDGAADLDYKIQQTKVRTKEEERTEIEIDYAP